MTKDEARKLSGISELESLEFQRSSALKRLYKEAIRVALCTYDEETEKRMKPLLDVVEEIGRIDECLLRVSSERP